ncbi:hypothetical protein HYH03_010296 [Edaphochlamys debaryana]|uniref:Glycosyl transferase CAP10 domain-containing protein n=1 Tax=Edaphochlamys debaryana TaxID=47281 RepID=A0A836BWB2_9CHLO|nr:hypothetical protein HYH03_010296 [Edaphochlamys debaryana]|eukprot:KAG2491290.1 hypothetical protein HYH03_010296 [Edaphochlamys debaryana]
MARLYEDNLEQDLAFWRRKLKGGKLSIKDLLTTFDNYMSRTQQGDPNWISSSNSVVLIKDNKWYAPFRPFEYDTNCTKQDTFCDPRIMQNQWAFDRWTRKLGIKFPDVIFFHDTGDAGACLGGEHTCPAPVFTYFKQRDDPTFTERWGTGKMPYPVPHRRTILMPSAYMDVNRDGWPNYTPMPLYRFPFEKKVPKAIFRGAGWCPTWHHPRFVFCARWHLADNLTHVHPQQIDAVKDGGKKEYLSIKDHVKFKFVVAADGTGPSNRFSKLLHLDSLVLKEDSPFLAHFYRSVHPWQHYVPIFAVNENDTLTMVEHFNHPDREYEYARIVDNANKFAAKYLCDRALGLYFRKSLEEYKALFEDMQGFIDSTVWPLVQAKRQLGIDYHQSIAPFQPMFGRRARHASEL